MKEYYIKVDLRSRKAMINFLKKHYRYHTLNSWNCSTSYANNVKVYNLGLTSAEEDKLYELLEMSEFYDRISFYFDDFAREFNYQWQAGFNGRSSGYIVLYKGYVKNSEYKSFCTECGQRNYKTVEETGNCKCGRCGRDTRVNFSKPPLEYGTYPGRSVDMAEDFSEWDIYTLRERVLLVSRFDKMCDSILKEVKNIIENFQIEEETVYVPKKVKMLKEAS